MEASVWAATWVPSPSPFPGFGADGYAVAWVDPRDGARRQVLVAGDAAPSIGTTGTVELQLLGDGDDRSEVPMFVAGAGGEVGR
jgi:hypothetical protein